MMQKGTGTSKPRKTTLNAALRLSCASCEENTNTSNILERIRSTDVMQYVQVQRKKERNEMVLVS